MDIRLPAGDMSGNRDLVLCGLPDFLQGGRIGVIV